MSVRNTSARAPAVSGQTTRIAIGAPRVLTAIEQAGDDQVVVAGLSEGTLVVDEVQRRLAADPKDAPIVDAGYKRNDAKTRDILDKALVNALTKLTELTKPTRLAKPAAPRRFALPKLTLPKRITRPATARAPRGAAWRAAAHR